MILCKVDSAAICMCLYVPDLHIYMYLCVVVHMTGDGEGIAHARADSHFSIQQVGKDKNGGRVGVFKCSYTSIYLSIYLSCKLFIASKVSYSFIPYICVSVSIYIFITICSHLSIYLFVYIFIYLVSFS